MIETDYFKDGRAANIRALRKEIRKAKEKTTGLIGDKYVSIIPGADDAMLKDNEILLDTQAALDIEEMISKYVFGSVEK